MATQTVNQLETALLTTARASGAGAYLLDDIVDKVIAAAGARTEADACKDMSFVGAQVNKTVEGLMAADTLKSFRAVVQGAVRDVSCLPSPTSAKLAQRLSRVAARNLQGYPVEVADTKAKRVRFRFNLDKFTEREVTVPVTRVSVNQSAVLRRHADDTFTFVRLGDHETRQAVVRKVTALKDPVGWVEVELGAASGEESYGFTVAKGTPVMGQTATIFVDPKTQQVTKFVQWGARPATRPTTAPPTVAPTAPPTVAPVDAGAKISVTIRNKNDSEAEGEADGRPGGPYGVPLVVGEALVPSPTDAPTDEPLPQQPIPVECSNTCPELPPPCPTTGLTKPGTFFCMTRRTFMIVVCMLVLASALAALGYWIYRKKALGGGAATGPGDGLGDLGFGGTGADLGLGGPPR